MISCHVLAASALRGSRSTLEWRAQPTASMGRDVGAAGLIV
jgi:hypothetical protein